MEWAIAHWQDIWAVVSAVVIFAHAVTEVTPTPQDDEVLKEIFTLLRKIGLKFGDPKD